MDKKTNRLYLYTFITLLIALSVKYFYLTGLSITIPLVASLVFVMISLKMLSNDNDFFKKNKLPYITQFASTTIVAIAFIINDICTVLLYNYEWIFSVILFLALMGAIFILVYYTLKLMNVKIEFKKNKKVYDKSVPKEVITGEFEQKPNNIKKNKQIDLENNDINKNLSASSNLPEEIIIDDKDLDNSKNE